MTSSVWALALASISLSSIAQLLMKVGTTGVRLAVQSGSPAIFATVTNMHIVAGFAAYGIGAILWLSVLSRVDLSMAYPLVSLGFVLVAILSWLVLGEHMPPGRLMGIALIVAGVALVGGTTG